MIDIWKLRDDTDLGTTFFYYRTTTDLDNINFFRMLRVGPELPASCALRATAWEGKVRFLERDFIHLDPP